LANVALWGATQQWRCAQLAAYLFHAAATGVFGAAADTTWHGCVEGLVAAEAAITKDQLRLVDRIIGVLEGGSSV